MHRLKTQQTDHPEPHAAKDWASKVLADPEEVALLNSIVFPDTPQAKSAPRPPMSWRQQDQLGDIIRRRKVCVIKFVTY